MALPRTKTEKEGEVALAPRNAGTLQSAKAAQTRARLIDATIRCLVKYGYAKTTTPRVAAEAGLSRGAMMHHFENSAALVKATVIALHERRLRAFRRAADKPQHEVGDLVAAYWRQVQKPAFIAFHELAVAARTDPDLARIMKPLQEEFTERFNAQAEQLFPEWEGARREFDLAMSLSQTILEGMAIAVETGAMSREKVEPLLRNLEDQIRALMPGDNRA
ncbi:putative TetR-family transcriptional regulator [Novosphingobium marinum]|uniref:AcrR family transcriptional regulator n=1 Tax=Novosphingobium marinum TaxID=1514948 RepID=A0A7Y9XWR4_9SPHN|nr:TetR/AcrR family transcriptional regulator [Novosphingobium marinum]NYH94498.1 AcrR family transcriptional regulator [Novosphingobium marinum]GGC22785.1 putative TetR-family transcriptional regulator [Novosphingobium marinum]